MEEEGGGAVLMPKVMAQHEMREREEGEIAKGRRREALEIERVS